MREKRKCEGKTALCVCAASALILLLLCSMSSPLYPINIWDDANCLLTVGRVMKEGGVLYRDVYEQKGPLLYFVHMLAAMISDSSFLGVFCMETAFFAALLFLCWKLLRLYGDSGSAYAGMLLFGVCVLVSRAFARGDSAEEYCLPFLMAALYTVCVQDKRRTGALNARAMLLLGLLAGCVAAIKYTALGLFAGLCAAQGIYLMRKRAWKRLLAIAAAFLLGMLLALLPWVFYFAAHGALGDAYAAYIHNNIFLYNAQRRTLMDILGEVLTAGRENLLWALPSAVGTAAWALNPRRSGFARLCVALAALCAGAAVFLPGTVYPYYPLVLSVFAPFGLLLLVHAAQRLIRRPRALAGMTAALALGAAWLLSPNAFLRGVPLADTAQGRLAARMEEGATLLQYSHLDDGLYLASGALPQEKYFVRLNVDLPDMQAALDDAVREGRPDYVLVSWRELPEAFDRYELIAYETGYDDDGRLNKDLYLYRRKEP